MNKLEKIAITAFLSGISIAGIGKIVDYDPLIVGGIITMVAGNILYAEAKMGKIKNYSKKITNHVH